MSDAFKDFADYPRIPAHETLRTVLQMWIRYYLLDESKRFGRKLTREELLESVVRAGPFMGTIIGEYAMAETEIIPEADRESEALLFALEASRRFNEEIAPTAQRFIRQFPRSKR